MILRDADLIALQDEKDGFFISPFDEDAVQPASYDLHLGPSLKALPPDTVIDPEIDQSSAYGELLRGDDGRWLLEAGRGYLGMTRERIAIPEDCVGLLHGISSLGRFWLLIHCTAGLIDGGFTGRLTLEIVPLAHSIYLRPGMRIGQITVHKLTAAAELPYDGRYQRDMDATPSRAWMDYAEETDADAE